MKLLVLMLTFMFSFGVIADCCNFELEYQSEQAAVTDNHCHDDGIPDDHSHDSPQDHEHNDASHCHCTSGTHIRLIPKSLYFNFSPDLRETVLHPTNVNFYTSLYEALIFHPPIA